MFIKRTIFKLLALSDMHNTTSIYSILFLYLNNIKFYVV